jgi:hypothetical protein
MFRAILDEEGHIFGKSLRTFYENNKTEICKTPAQYLW